MGEIVIGQTNKKIPSGKLQRVLRSNMSDAEKVLWHLLRGRQISGLKFRRQHPFGDYILDFVCLENRMVIEVDGGNMDSGQYMMRIVHKNYRRLVFAFSDSGTTKFCRRWNR